MFNLLSRQNNFFVLPEFAGRVTKSNTRDWEMVLLVFSEFPWVIREKLSDPFHSWKMLKMLVLYFHCGINLNNWLNWVKNRFVASAIFWTIQKFTQPIAWSSTGDPEPEGVFGLFWRTVCSAQVLHLQN